MSGHTPAPERDITSEWICALEAYVKETNVSCLDLGNFGDMNISVETVLSILKFLPESQVTELILKGIYLSEGMKTFREYIKMTKIKKLSIENCSLFSSELTNLAEVLNDTNIVELHVPGGWHDVTDERKLASNLIKSRLIKLSLTSWTLGNDGILSFAEGLPISSLTSLHIDDCAENAKALVSLCSKLPHSQIVDLSLSNNGHSFNNALITELSQYLPASKIKKLRLADFITDGGLDVLAQSLVKSTVTVLDLYRHRIHDLYKFGQLIKDSKIRVLRLCSGDASAALNAWDGPVLGPNFLKISSLEELDMSSCGLNDETGAELIRSLKSTKLKKLNLKDNFLGHLSITELAAMLKDSSLEDIDLSKNNPISSEEFDLLGECIKESRLKHIALGGRKDWEDGKTVFCLRLFQAVIDGETNFSLRFLAAIKNSSVLTVEMRENQFYANDADLFAQALSNSTFTHCDLKKSKLRDIFSTLVSNLKYTSITHLNLSECNIGDEDIQLLAEHLSETKIMHLNLSDNDVSDVGAKALAACFPQTALIHLNLEQNRIKKKGLEILAKHATGSLIITLKAQGQRDYPELKYMITVLEKILLENRIRSQKLVSFFNKVIPQDSGRTFCFHQCINNSNVQEFLEECLKFSKSVMELPQPAVISVLLEGARLPFSREDIVALLGDEFSQQLVEFIRTSIEADAGQHVKLLKQAEELGLVKIVEGLLLSRPLFMIDEAEDIMHPDVYGLLVKYKQPICSEAIEPQAIERIKEYFIVHSDLEGAENVVNLLSSDKRKVSPHFSGCK